MLEDSGSYVYSWIHQVFGQVSMKFYKVGMFLDILINPILVYFLLKRYTPLETKHSLFVALLVLVWPGYHVSINTTFFPVWIVQTTFYAGWLLFLYQKEKGGKFVLALPAYCLIFISFNYNSCLVYQYAVLGVVFLYECGYPKNLSEIDFRSRIPGFLKVYWVLFALPIVYWIIRQIYLKPHDSMAAYNPIQLFRVRTLENFIKYVKHVYLDFLEGPLYIETPLWLVMIPTLGISVWVYKKIYLEKARFEAKSYCKGAMLLGFIVICFLAVPYAVVGKHVNLFHWGARHGILAGPALGVFIVGFLGWLLAKKEGKAGKWENLIFCQILIYLVFLDIGLYSSWQARRVKDVAAASQLRKVGPLPNVNTYIVRDHVPRGLSYYISFTTEINMLLFEAWKKEEFMGIVSMANVDENLLKHLRYINVLWEGKKNWTAAATTNFDPKGCLGEIIFTPKQEKHEVLTTFRYFYFKFLNPENMKTFLDDFMEVELKPLGIDVNGEPCPKV